MSCHGGGSLIDRVTPAPPFDAYRKGLLDSGLDRRVLGRTWLAAAEDALASAPRVELPIEEVVHASPSAPRGFGWRFEVRRGQRLMIDVRREGMGALAFVDVFQPQLVEGDTGFREALAHDEGIEGPAMLAVEIDADGDRVVRVMPELLGGGRYTISIRTGPSLEFPVEERDSESVGSFFGAPRDRGRRKHHGVDIFAPKGQPAVACADGFVTRAGTDDLGGNVIWLRDSARRLTYYYAHLDEHIATTGQRVRAGDVVGLVGKTGNARTTPPHLHFGIYGGGPIDPFPFLARPEDPAPVTAALSPIGAPARIRGKRANIRAGATTDSAILDALDRHAAVRVLGARERWYRIALYDGREGYVHGSLLEQLDEGVEALRLAADAPLRTEPDPNAPIFTSLNAGEALTVWARHGDHVLVSGAERSERGWLKRPEPT